VAVERVTAVWTANPSVSFARTILVDFCALRVPYTIAQLARLKNVPIVIVHGEADVAYPVEYSEDFVNDLKDAGVLNVELKVVEDGPHYLTITHPNEYGFQFSLQKLLLILHFTGSILGCAHLS